jgi:hypothetical protein
MRSLTELDVGALASEFNGGEPASLVARLVLFGKVGRGRIRIITKVICFGKILGKNINII